MGAGTQGPAAGGAPGLPAVLEPGGTPEAPAPPSLEIHIAPPSGPELTLPDGSSRLLPEVELPAVDLPLPDEVSELVPHTLP